jgi:flagellin
MSFRINGNIEAMNAYGNLSRVTSSYNKSLSRLSSGLRIADAADDPAGLISAEAFRSQIDSIDAAVRNNQDATNMTKTAESGMAEISSLLNEARSLAVASSNTTTLSGAQIAANQDQMNTIAQAINRVSANTSYGGKALLDGSAGSSTQISNASKISGISFSGSVSFSTGSASVTQGGLITVQQTVAATRALYTATATLSTGAIQSGQIALNGVSFNVTAGTSGTDLATMVNSASNQTGVSATFDTTSNTLRFQQLTAGAGKSITFSDTTGVVSAAANTNANTVGVNAVAQVNFGLGNVLMTGGRNGNDGLSLTDAAGNSVRIAESGNAVSAAGAVGRVIAGDATFQIGANVGQTVGLSLRNLSSNQLGAGVATGVSVANLDLSTAAGASTAMRVLDQAISEVASSRGKVGAFQRYTLESNNRSLASMKENFASAESSIRDLDVADEMTKFTKYQVMQQAGMAMLGQANQKNQIVLGLLGR